MIHVTYVKRTPLLADLLAYCQSAFTGSAPGRTSQLLRLRMLPADGIHSLAASGSATLPVLRLCSDLACITHTPILCKNLYFVKKQFRHFIQEDFFNNNGRKRRKDLKRSQRQGGFAVPFRNPGISNGLRRCLMAKQCEWQLGFASNNPLTLLNNIASPR